MANHDRIERKLELCLSKAASDTLKGRPRPNNGKIDNLWFTRKPGQKYLLLTKKYYKNRGPVGR